MAVANAETGLKEVADQVTGGRFHQGVMEVLEQLHHERLNFKETAES